MARPFRADYTNTFHHVVIRGLDGLSIFDKPEKRNKFLKIIIESRKKHDLKIYAFGFLNTHWHGFVRRRDITMSRFFQAVKSRYANWYNKKYSRTGPLYDGRYFSSIVESDSYFSMVWSYVQNQGVKAGLYKNPVHDPGSTAGLYAGVHNDYEWIDWKEAIGILDIPINNGNRKMEKWLEEQAFPEKLPKRKKRNQYFIASDKYIEKYMQIRKHEVRKRSRSKTPVNWDMLLKGAEVLHDCKPEVVLKPSKRPRIHSCRAGIAYAAHRYGHKTIGEISKKLNFSDATVSRMIHKIIRNNSNISILWDKFIIKET